MEIFHLENKKYIVVCPECSEILKFKINTENMTVSGECKNNHILRDKTIEYFKNNCIKSSNEINNKCFNCYELLDDNFNNFICLRCNKLFCGNCIIFPFCNYIKNYPNPPCLPEFTFHSKDH